MPSIAVPTARYHAAAEPAPVAGGGSVRRAPDARWLLLAVLLLSAVYVFWHLGRGWVPHDEGALGQGAERVLQGQLPHADFDDIYTGGLAYLNAAAFELLGTSLWTLRLVLFAVFLAWIPAVFYIASRLVAPLAAAGVTLLAVVWSVPNYPAPLPSWYNLFFATFGVAALFRHLERPGARWLVLAGLAGGLSFLVKVVGLYYVAGVFLFLLHRSHAQSRAAAGPTPRRGLAYSTFVTAGLLFFVAELGLLVRRQLYAPEVMQFVLPGALLAALLLHDEWTRPAGDSRTRFTALARLMVPFLAGIALPVVLFLVPYARANAVGAFVNGVFILPTRRFGFAAWRALPVATTLALVPGGLLVLAARRLRADSGRTQQVVLAVAVVALVVATGQLAPVYRTVWYAVRNLLPALVVCGVVVLSRPRAADAESPLLRERTMLLLCVAALCGIVQFPFAAPIYFCYVAPLAALAAVALLSYARPASRHVGTATLAFLIAFAVLRTNTSSIYGMGLAYEPYLPTAPLTTRRGGLAVSRDDAAKYDALVAMLRQRARGEYTWASPDCPEVYFLSGLRNPTRSLFEFFENPNDRTERILATLESHGVTAIVLNTQPSFSPGITQALYDRLEQRYPFGANVGSFQLRWRQ